jgi:hypothetical protein
MAMIKVPMVQPSLPFCPDFVPNSPSKAMHNAKNATVMPM